MKRRNALRHIISTFLHSNQVSPEPAVNVWKIPPDLNFLERLKRERDREREIVRERETDR